MSTLLDPAQLVAVSKSLIAHRRVAGYTLPPALDAKRSDLSERKESLTAEERAELLGLVAFTQARSIEMAEAELAIRRLTDAYPELVAHP
jgi:predicted MarR family transcription regulator